MTNGDRFVELSGGEKFVVAARIVPPTDAGWNGFEKQLAHIKKAHWVFIGDDTDGAPHISTALTALKLKGAGLEPLPELGLRDRNRIALRGEAMGLALWGVKGIWCSTGVHQSLGRTAAARNVYDLDLPQLVALLKGKDRVPAAAGSGAEGEAGEGVARGAGGGNGAGIELVVGAQVNPAGGPLGLRLLMLAKLIDAGADFFVTIPIADSAALAEWLDAAMRENLLPQPRIIVSLIAPDDSADLERLERTLPGTNFGAEWKEAAAKGPDGVVALAGPLGKKVKDLKGVAGINVWTGSTGEAAARLIEALAS